MLRPPYDTGLRLYPLIWLSWDYISDCYHGQSMITGLIPNQNFINKIFALTGVSLLATAFPKVIYDKNRVRSWDGSVGAAIGVAGGVDGVAQVMAPAAVNPQIAQFMELCMDRTQSFLGASDVALGEGRPENTSAIIALQRAANTPMEMTKQNLYQAVEDMGRIFLDLMAARYGPRWVQGDGGETELFDFSVLGQLPMGVKLDVGASSYWSEIASMQTLDSLLLHDKISLRQYLERIPQGYIARKQELLDELPGGETGGVSLGVGVPDRIPVRGASGDSALQRQLRAELG